MIKYNYLKSKRRGITNEDKCLSTAGTVLVFQSSCADKTPYLKVVGIYPNYCLQLYSMTY